MKLKRHIFKCFSNLEDNRTCKNRKRASKPVLNKTWMMYAMIMKVFTRFTFRCLEIWKKNTPSVFSQNANDAMLTECNWSTAYKALASDKKCSLTTVFKTFHMKFPAFLSMCECARGTTKFDRKYKSLFFRNVFFRMFLFFSNWNYFAAIAHRKQNNTQTHSDQGPDKGVGGQCPGTALLVKRRKSKWPFTNEPEVRFRF